ncbi:MAG: hypothetical protein IJO53_12760, partial [Clostridia bacterium]|nr:hypothetical protein [Clostridia bacterium]
MKHAVKVFSLLCVLALAVSAIGGLSEESTCLEPQPNISIRHMLETLSGSFEPAEDHEEEPNPEYVPSGAFIDSLEALSRKYVGFMPEEVKTEKDSDGNIFSAEVYYK